MVKLGLALIDPGRVVCALPDASADRDAVANHVLHLDNGLRIEVRATWERLERLLLRPDEDVRLSEADEYVARALDLLQARDAAGLDDYTLNTVRACLFEAQGRLRP